MQLYLCDILLEFHFLLSLLINSSKYYLHLIYLHYIAIPLRWVDAATTSDLFFGVMRWCCIYELLIWGCYMDLYENNILKWKSPCYIESHLYYQELYWYLMTIYYYNKKKVWFTSIQSFIYKYSYKIPCITINPSLTINNHSAITNHSLPLMQLDVP